MIELKSRKHTQWHISAVSSRSCICLLYCTFGLFRECADICDKDMNGVDTEGGFSFLIRLEANEEHVRAETENKTAF